MMLKGKAMWLKKRRLTNIMILSSSSPQSGTLRLERQVCIVLSLVGVTKNKKTILTEGNRAQARSWTLRYSFSNKVHIIIYYYHTFDLKSLFYHCHSKNLPNTFHDLGTNFSIYSFSWGFFSERQPNLMGISWSANNKTKPIW